MCVENTLPAGVIRQIPAGDTTKTHEPAFKTAVPGINILNVDGATRADACLNIDSLVRNAGVGAKAPVRCRAIADQQDIGGQDRQQTSRQLRRPHLTAAGVKIESLPAAVAGDEQAVVLAMDASTPGDTAALAGRTVEIAGSLLRFQSVGFVRFDDGEQLTRPLARRRGHEAMTPAEARRPVYPRDRGGLTHGARVEHALQISQPAIFLAQPRQRRARQGVIAAPAAETAEALQTAGLAAPM